MFKEKCEKTIEFVKDHKVEFVLGGLSALGLGTLGVIVSKQSEQIKELVKALKVVTTVESVTATSIQHLNEDVEALAKHCGLTIEQVWDIALENKYGDILNK